MEFEIKVATTDVKITVSSNDYSERELNFIEVIMLNIAAPTNMQFVGENLAFNPLDRNENDVFHFQFAWQKSLEEKVYNVFEENLRMRIETALKMSDIKDGCIEFKVNSYQTN